MPDFVVEAKLKTDENKSTSSYVKVQSDWLDGNMVYIKIGGEEARICADDLIKAAHVCAETNW